LDWQRAESSPNRLRTPPSGPGRTGFGKARIAGRPGCAATAKSLL